MREIRARGNRLTILVAIVVVLLLGLVAFGVYSKATTADHLQHAEKVLRPQYEQLDLQRFSAGYERALVNGRLDRVQFPSAPHAQWVNAANINASGIDVLYEVDSPGRTACLAVATAANPGHPNTVTFSTSGHTANSGTGCH